MQSQNQIQNQDQFNSSQFQLTKIRKTQNLNKTPIEKSNESCLIKPQRALRFVFIVRCCTFFHALNTVAAVDDAVVVVVVFVVAVIVGHVNAFEYQINAF